MARTYYRDSYGRFASGPGGRRGGGERWKGSGASRGRPGSVTSMTRREGRNRRVIQREYGNGRGGGPLRETSVRYVGGRGTPSRRNAIAASAAATATYARPGGGVTRPRQGQTRTVVKRVNRSGAPYPRGGYIVTVGRRVGGG